jgi:adenylate cyclase
MAEAEEALDIDAYLASLGATEQQIAIARRDCHLAGLSGDLILSEGVSLSAADLADRASIGVDDAVALWRTMGVAVPDGQAVMFTERDADLTSFVVKLSTTEFGGIELLRVLGSSLARVAEAAVSFFVQTAEPESIPTEADALVAAQLVAMATAGALKLGDSMGAVFAHHLRDAIERQRIAQADVTDRSLHRLAVGFVDLVGFTPLALHTTPSALLELITLFEIKAFEVVSAYNGRIVKHIGDEVMFVALDAGSACAIARGITAAYAEGIEPRGGVAFGEVITRHGDYYGSVVNLASRLAELAVPKEVLVDEATAASAGEGFSFRPAGHRLLKGFDRPLEVYSLDSPVPETAGERADQ